MSRALDTFLDTFRQISVAIPVIASAPGRVNLIGEHTDYSGGYVLPLALEQRTEVCLAVGVGAPGTLTAHSVEAGQASVPLDAAATGVWTDYLIGAVKILGLNVPSLTVAIASDVPLGAGLSSSAALEVATLRALRAALSLKLSDYELAYAAQRIENEHLGLKTGIMDQMAASLGQPGAPLLFDTYTGKTEPLPMFSDAVFMIFHSGVSRRLVDGAYNDRRAATDFALEHLGVKRLVNIHAAQITHLPTTIQPRIRHVVSENARVLQAAEALKADAPEPFGALMSAAHVSMRDDFEASHEQVDVQVAFAQDQGALGARITGAGFGGSYVVLAPRNSDLADKILTQFPHARRVA